MAPQDLHKKINAQPFHPFRVHISDGASYDVIERAFVYMSITELIVGIEPDEYGVPKRSIYIAPNHVTRVEPITRATT